VSIDRLNTQLKNLLGLPSPSNDCPLWPADPLYAAPLEIDEKQVITAGLTNRADLNLLRAILRDLDAQTLATARQVLGTVTPLLAGPAQNSCRSSGLLSHLAPCLLRDEVEKVRGQVQALLAEREQEVVRQIREALSRVRSQLVAASLAQQRVDLAQTRVAELRERLAQGAPGERELGKARLELHNTQGDLLHEVVEWEIAGVQLKLAEGILAVECAHPRAVDPNPAGCGW
jgi:hypothetical protein